MGKKPGFKKKKESLWMNCDHCGIQILKADLLDNHTCQAEHIERRKAKKQKEVRKNAWKRQMEKTLFVDGCFEMGKRR